jgi:hypothetical protein
MAEPWPAADLLLVRGAREEQERALSRLVRTRNVLRFSHLGLNASVGWKRQKVYRDGTELFAALPDSPLYMSSRETVITPKQRRNGFYVRNVTIAMPWNSCSGASRRRYVATCTAWSAHSTLQEVLILIHATYPTTLRPPVLIEFRRCAGVCAGRSTTSAPVGGATARTAVTWPSAA